jgi:hypothetical protein
LGSDGSVMLGVISSVGSIAAGMGTRAGDSTGGSIGSPSSGEGAISGVGLGETLGAAGAGEIVGATGAEGTAATE